jgi:hypothetical protein
MTFPEIVTTWLNLHEDPEDLDDGNDATDNLAREFEVSGSTVKRWGRNIAKPHPGIKAQVLKHISEAIEWHQRYSGYCGCDWCDGCEEINEAIEGWINE